MQGSIDVCELTDGSSFLEKDRLVANASGVDRIPNNMVKIKVNWDSFMVHGSFLEE